MLYQLLRQRSHLDCFLSHYLSNKVVLKALSFKTLRLLPLTASTDQPNWRCQLTSHLLQQHPSTASPALSANSYGFLQNSHSSALKMSIRSQYNSNPTPPPTALIPVPLKTFSILISCYSLPFQPLAATQTSQVPSEFMLPYSSSPLYRNASPLYLHGFPSSLFRLLSPC